MNRYDDEHFKQWPFPVSDEEIQTDGYLKSLTPVEELAVFLSLRGNCLREAGRDAEAANYYAAASRLAPGWNATRALLADAQSEANVTASQPAPPPPYANIQQINSGSGGPNGVPDPNPLLKVR